ncbi:MAG: hypothetical protein RMJ36_01430 [Candidatus Calescibacterium sp.]|nr:hypothetical protein [Candidatus Calescibacterium sp.]MDW8132301.1 hypothetical protein [Candidatus Calescibacterium sp.]
MPEAYQKLQEVVNKYQKISPEEYKSMVTKHKIITSLTGAVIGGIIGGILTSVVNKLLSETK